MHETSSDWDVRERTTKSDQLQLLFQMSENPLRVVEPSGEAFRPVSPARDSAHFEALIRDSFP